MVFPQQQQVRDTNGRVPRPRITKSTPWQQQQQQQRTRKRGLRSKLSKEGFQETGKQGVGIGPLFLSRPPPPQALQQEQQQQQESSQQNNLPPISLVSTCEEMNPSRRSSFEDCSIYAPSGTWNSPDENMAFLAIADGHGGRDIVEFLEDALLYHVSEELQTEQQTDDPSIGNDVNDDIQTITTNDSIPDRLERAFLMVDIHSKARGLTNSGATVALCLVTRGKNIYNTAANQSNDDDTWTIYAANAGDARIVLGHGGKAHRMTRDHRTDDPDEVRRIEESGGFIFKGRVLGILAVTRSLGDHCMKEYVIATPYTSEKTFTIASETDGSFIVLACDGLWDVFRDQEAVDFVLERIDEKELVAKYLVEEALRRGSTDNITVSVAFLS
mmetsp:Transcript_92538/g.188396  ORF Transcript_92538/g.188396 Transcript_92538/m.188396 type:complete len:386 (-) Transcript_92538:2127-3284(-)